MLGVKRLPYIPPYSRRVDFCRKIRETEKQVQFLKNEGRWREMSHFTWYLRNVWWGYKRYMMPKKQN